MCVYIVYTFCLPIRFSPVHKDCPAILVTLHFPKVPLGMANPTNA